MVSKHQQTFPLSHRMTQQQIGYCSNNRTVVPTAAAAVAVAAVVAVIVAVVAAVAAVVVVVATIGQ